MHTQVPPAPQAVSGQLHADEKEAIVIDQRIRDLELVSDARLSPADSQIISTVSDQRDKLEKQLEQASTKISEQEAKIEQLNKELRDSKRLIKKQEGKINRRDLQLDQVREKLARWTRREQRQESDEAEKTAEVGEYGKGEEGGSRKRRRADRFTAEQ